MSNQSEQIIGLLNYIRGEQENFYASLPENERTRNGTWETWAPKDLVGHFTFWQNSLISILDTLDQTPPEQAPFEERNHANYLNNAARPWAEVYQDNARSYDGILTRVARLSDEDLKESKRFPRVPNGTLQTTILGNTYSHTATHLGELYDRYVAPGSGLEFQEKAAHMLIAADPTPYTRGFTLYNLACSYALSGDSGHTVELLNKAFADRPDLLEFSKEDTDFNLVRERPEFQALYA
jgi:hypothetical protein